jgi:hypothetical protein
MLARVPLAAEIALACLLARRELTRSPIEQALARLRGAPSCPPADAQLVQARHLARATARTLAYLPGDTRCLVRSLVLSRLLARRGIDSRLVLGTSTEPDFAAHAWVECVGVPVLDPGAGRFARLAEL